MSATIKPCHCGYEGALAGVNNGLYLVLSCPQCRREVTAFTGAGLIEAWNKPADNDKQSGEVKS